MGKYKACLKEFAFSVNVIQVCKTAITGQLASNSFIIPQTKVLHPTASMVDKSKFTPPGITTTAANQAQKHMGDRPTDTTNEPNFRPGETQLTLQWYGNKGKFLPG